MNIATLPIYGLRGGLRRGGARLGDTTTIDTSYDPTSPAYLAWQADVHARGGVVTVMPAPAGAPKNFQSPPGARFPDGSGGWVYELAPAGIVAADKLQAYQNAIAIAAGQAAGVAQSVAQSILDAPRNAIAGITGFSPTTVTWLAGGALVLFGLMKFGVTAKTFQKNPRGRRRRRRGHAVPRARRRRRA